MPFRHLSGTSPFQGVEKRFKTGDLEEFCNRNEGLVYIPVTKKCERIDVCVPNPCKNPAPLCEAAGDGLNYTCSCNDTSCGAGKTCVGGTCYKAKSATVREIRFPTATAGADPDCYEATTKWGECKKTCECVTCAKAKKCVEGECINCPLGEDCGCAEDDAHSNGSGMCEPNDPCADVTCDASWHCEEGECVADPCPSGYEAGKTCGDGYKLETNGTSGGKSCGKCVEDYECTSNSDCADDEYCSAHKCVKVQCNGNIYYPDFLNCSISNHRAKFSCKSDYCYHDGYCCESGPTCVNCGAYGNGVTSDCMCIGLDGSIFSPLPNPPEYD